MTRVLGKLGLVACLLALGRTSSLACSVCFGDPNSALGQGARWGVFSMIVIVACVLSGIGAFFVFLGKRSAAVAEMDSSSADTDPTSKV
ncbi:MAG: hypothetical protein K9N62_08295 [Verrucomicrobia bacterium]|jgi:hypothetical protein|nr:hypothetical protein [Verrucomicrobiota bacterium]